MPKIKDSETNFQFKILYTIGIVAVLVYHLGNGSTLKILDNWFAYNPFVLALFVFCSGYFYKPKNELHPIKYISKKVRHLIVPLLLWNFFYAGVVLLLSTKDFSIGHEINFDSLFLAPFRTGHQFVYNLGSWFIAPLFFIESTNILLRISLHKIKDKLPKELFLLVFSFILGVLGIHLAASNLTNGWMLLVSRTLFLFPFFEIGALYKKYLEANDKLPNLVYFGMIAASAIIVNTICGRVPSYITSSMTGFNNGALLPYLSALIPLAFCLRVSKILTPIIGKSKTINTIADNTYSIMVNHLLGFMLVKAFFAFISRFVAMSPSFNWTQFKSNIWYYYYPFNNKNFRILNCWIGHIYCYAKDSSLSIYIPEK